MAINTTYYNCTQTHSGKTPSNDRVKEILAASRKLNEISKKLLNPEPAPLPKENPKMEITLPPKKAAPKEDGGALHKAVLKGDFELAKKLIESGSPLDCLNEDHLSPLEVALIRNDEKMIRLFDSSSYLPSETEMNNGIKSIRELRDCLSHLSEIKSKTHLAAYNGDLSLLKGSEKLADPDDAGLTPLHYAIIKFGELQNRLILTMITGEQSPEIKSAHEKQKQVIAYLTKKSDPKQLDPFGNTYLHFSTMLIPKLPSEDAFLQGTLKNCGVDPSQKNKAGVTLDLLSSPLFYAKAKISQKHPFLLSQAEKNSAIYNCLSWPAWALFLYAMPAYPALSWVINPITMNLTANLYSKYGPERSEFTKTNLTQPLQSGTALSALPIVAGMAASFGLNALALPFKALNWMTGAPIFNTASSAINTLASGASNAGSWFAPLTRAMIGISAVNKTVAMAKHTLKKCYSSWKYGSSESKWEKAKALATRSFNLISTGVNALLLTGFWNPYKEKDECPTFDPSTEIHLLNPNCKDQAAQILGGESSCDALKKSSKELMVKYHPDKCKGSICEPAFKNVAAAYETLCKSKEAPQDSLLKRAFAWFKF